MIESLANPKIKYAMKLKQKKYRSLHKQFMVEGEHLVEEAIKSKMIESLFYTGENPFDYEGIEVSELVMNKLSELDNTSSFIAICNKQDTLDLSNHILILDGVQDPGNMGTLIRTAAAFGFETILSEYSVDYYNEKVIRSSQGALFYVNLIESDIIQFVKEHRDYRYFGTDVQSGEFITKNTFSEPKIAIILGNEGSGMRADLKDLVDSNIHLKMEKTESLNVGIAGGILMYEVYKE